MKKHVLSVLMLFSCALIAQEENTYVEKPVVTEIDQGATCNFKHGYYGGFSIYFASTLDQPMVDFSAKTAFLFDKQFAIGIQAGGSLGNVKHDFELDPSEGMIDPEDPSKGPSAEIRGYHGGIYLEYYLKSKSPVTFSFPLYVGMGYAEIVKEKPYDPYSNPDNEILYYQFGSSNYFLIQPSVAVNFKITRLIQLGIGIGYRKHTGLDLPQLTNSDFDAPVTDVSLKIGVF